MRRYTSSSLHMNYLDKYRLKNGADKLRIHFNHLCSKNYNYALMQLNSSTLRYPSLFALKNEIRSLGIFDKLNARNKSALDITDKIYNNNISLIYDKENYNTLSWMFNTGYMADGMSQRYDEVLDKTAILLIKVHKDNSCLNVVEKLIYNRHRKGSFIYDLVWAFLESRNPKCIDLMLKRLLSNNEKDILLSKKLLGFIPCITPENTRKKNTIYCKAAKWIKDNYNFIYYNGDHFHQTPKPSTFRLSLENKYLQNTTHLKSHENKRYYTDFEALAIDSFRKLESDSQKLLSDYSHYLHKHNRNMWNSWIVKSIPEQLEITKSSKNFRI
ncbi:hypothetical protein [Pseudobacteroides cellulosolvens]|uniref:Uncharacterized protein n=1 Tax=Pseudobacteroides cellulosolvens ATCC 35603 = DSM 2933 TaxID=398512 RepID=A0A0L6JMS7_9FIRM|nr:hypothetical protein [Pseudobacteroides cellulosolvens]KNY26682.1 hypothetical protein Bccel_1947 [Pseudobacteroides cellulosolvens ATCC 35603 = DSM 2933]